LPLDGSVAGGGALLLGDEAAAQTVGATLAAKAALVTVMQTMNSTAAVISISSLMVRLSQ
jgi:hypothetical protein